MSGHRRPVIRKWNTYNIDEVSPEFSVEGGKVDYSLRDNNFNKVFLEVKKASEDLEKHEEQLLFYSFRQGVKLASLTNGMTWWFYLPTKEGDWKTRKFYTIDIIQQESQDVAHKFIDLLSKNNIQTGEALRHAESIYKGKLKKTVIEETLPEAWNKIITEPDSLLIDLLSETTEKLCGFKPENEETTQFLKIYEGRFLLSPEEEIQITEPIRITPPPIPPGRRISQDELIPHIIKVLQKHGGRARKDQVEEEIYQMFKDIFKEPYYQETVANGVPRWQHNIAWAKERAKKRGLIKRPEDSGRGYWELTASGMKFN
jgi:predicted type IV restriction endonuclease